MHHWGMGILVVIGKPVTIVTVLIQANFYISNNLQFNKNVFCSLSTLQKHSHNLYILYIIYKNLYILYIIYIKIYIYKIIYIYIYNNIYV